MGAVAGFEVLDRPVAGWGVGGHDLVAHAFDGVEQGQLRAGVRAFAAHDEPGALRVSSGGGQAGDFADFGAVAEFTVGVDRGDPVSGLADRLADGFGDGHADGETGVDAVLAQGADVGKESLGAAGRVRPDQDRGAVSVGVRDLRERGVQDGDVVGGRVRPGPSFPQ